MASTLPDTVKGQEQGKNFILLLQEGTASLGTGKLVSLGITADHRGTKADQLAALACFSYSLCVAHTSSVHTYLCLFTISTRGGVALLPP